MDSGKTEDLIGLRQRRELVAHHLPVQPGDHQRLRRHQALDKYAGRLQLSRWIQRWNGMDLPSSGELNWMRSNKENVWG